MHRRKWSSKKKSQIILQGLKGRPIIDICQEYQISQSMYYAWRDKFLEHMDKAFDISHISRKEAYKDKQIDGMKKLIAELTIELKKNEDEW